MGHNIWDVHNYLEIDGAVGRIKIDVTWSHVLTSAGFPTTVEWDGTTDFRIAAPLGEVIQVSDPTLLNDLKESLLARVNTASALAMREQYILALAAFASRHSAAPSRSEGITLTLRAIRSRQPRSERRHEEPKSILLHWLENSIAASVSSSRLRAPALDSVNALL